MKRKPMTKSQVEAMAEQTRQKMDEPDKWRTSVWDNIGWHFCLEHIPSNAALTVWPGYLLEPEFSAMLTLGEHGRCGDTRWTDNFKSKNPQTAVDHQMMVASAILDAEMAKFNLITSKL